MLAEFEQAKRDLGDIKQELIKATSLDPASSDQVPPGQPGPDKTRDIKFLKARAVDLLKDIFGDSASTLAHIKEVSDSGDTAELLLLIDRALKTSPPLRRALSSDEDSRTMIALVDAAVWRSWIFRACSAVTILALTIGLGMTGFNIAGLSSQAETVRKFFDDAKNKSQENLATMSDGVNTLRQQTTEFEKNRKEVTDRINSLNSILNNPDSEVNKVVASFATKLTQLSDIERDWNERKTILANALSRHETFLSNREADVTQKTTEILANAGNQITAIEALLTTAKSRASDITGLAASSKTAADAIQAQAGQADKSVQKIEVSKQQADTAISGINTAGEKIQTIRQSSEAASVRIASVEEEIGKQGKGVATAAAAATAEIGTSKTGFLQSGSQVVDSLKSLQTNTTEYGQTVQATKDAVIKQGQEIARLLLEAGTKETEITKRLQDITTEQARQKGELVRAKELIDLVEAKRVETSDELRKMLAKLDAETVWKFVSASNVLLGLAVSIALLLLALLFTLIALVRTRRRLPKPATPATGT